MVKNLVFSGAILCCALLFTGATDAQAQMTCAVPQMPVPNWGPMINTPMQNIPANCPCGCGSTGGCVDNPGSCDLWVSSGQNNGTVSSRPYPVKPPTNCKGSMENISFYRGEQRCVATIKVPKKVEQTREKYRRKKDLERLWMYCFCMRSLCD